VTQPSAHDGISELFDADPPESSSLWSRDELGDVLRHQLNSPLGLDLPGVPAQEGTFSQLLFSPHPRRELLVRLEQFAKSPQSAPGLPREIAMTIYLCAIAAARLRLGPGEPISTLSDHSFVRGVRWALRQEWLDDGSRRLLTDASKLIESEPRQ